jgi:hypothetical protein
MVGMTRISVDVTNEALQAVALGERAAEIVAALDSVEMDFSGLADSWRSGGRDLSRLEEAARKGDAA